MADGRQGASLDNLEKLMQENLARAKYMEALKIKTQKFAERNTEYRLAKGFVSTRSMHIISTGITLSPKPKSHLRLCKE